MKTTSERPFQMSMQNMLVLLFACSVAFAISWYSTAILLAILILTLMHVLVFGLLLVFGRG